MYKCWNCEHTFLEEDAELRHDTYESYYGVASLFPDSHPMSYLVCPYCGSEDIEEYDEDDEEEEDSEE